MPILDLSNFEIRRDVICGRLRASLRVTLKHACFTVIPYTTGTFYGNLPQIRNDIMSNLEVGQSEVLLQLTSSFSFFQPLLVHTVMHNSLRIN